jgi:hypothetical protein
MFLRIYSFFAIVILAVVSGASGHGGALAATSTGGTFTLGASSYQVAQTGGSVKIQVNRINGSTGAASVRYHTTFGTALDNWDYGNTYGLLTWSAGDATAKSVSVPIFNKSVITASRSLSFTLSTQSGAALGAPSSATITITPAGSGSTAAAGALQLATASTTVAQKAGTVALSVMRAGGTSGAVSVAYQTANGTAVAGTNFTQTSGTLSWPNGDAAAKTVSVPISNSTPFTGSKSFTVALGSPSGGATVSTPTSASVAITGSATGTASGAPSAVTNLVLTNQGGANNAALNANSLTNSQSIKWGAATPGNFPISHYQIYRNGAAYATTTGLTYTDSAATNSNDVMPNDFSGSHFNAPRTAYTYNVAAVDTQGSVGPQASQFTYWEHANGVAAWGETAFNPSPPVVTMNWFSTAIAHAGSPSVISVATNSSYQYIQPSSGAPGTPLWSFESGAFAGGYMQMDIYPTKANQTFKLDIISRVTPGDFYNNVGVILGTNSGYGPSPMVPNAWNHYKIPMGAGTAAAPGLQMGFATFQGYISGKRLTITSISGQMQINPTDWITAPGMVTDYILGPGPSDGGSTANGAGGVGTYDMNVSQTVGSIDAPVTFTAQRTNVYKWSLQDETQYGANLWYMDNIGFTTH